MNRWQITYSEISLFCHSVAKSRLTLCDPMDCSTPAFPVLHHFPEACSNSCPSCQWCHPAISSCCPLLLPSISPSIRAFSNESTLHMRWPKYWSSNISPSNEGLISFRIDWFDLCAVQGTLKGLLQHHSLKASILWCSVFLTVQMSHPYVTTGKNYSFDLWTFVSKVMSLFFNMQSRFDIIFLPRIKCLLISWLQSPSTVIFRAQEKNLSLFPLFSINLPWSEAMALDLSFLNVEL